MKMKCPNCQITLKLITRDEKEWLKCPDPECIFETNVVKDNKISCLYALITNNPDQGGDGIPVAEVGNRLFPMVCSNWKQVEDLKRLIPQLRKAGTGVRLMRFHHAEEIDTSDIV